MIRNRMAWNLRDQEPAQAVAPANGGRVRVWRFAFRAPSRFAAGLVRASLPRCNKAPSAVEEAV